jgi:DNA-binding response OmpR family regulator
MAKVLVVDDDVPLARLLRVVLQQGDHEASTSTTLSEARDFIVSEKPDLILLSIQLGAENGGDLVSWARASGYCGAFMVVSTVDGHAAATELDADGWLEMPFDPDRVLQSIQALLARPRRAQPTQSGVLRRPVRAWQLSRSLRGTSFNL